MVQFNQISNKVADNTVLLNGVQQYNITDDEMIALNTLILTGTLVEALKAVGLSDNNKVSKTTKAVSTTLNVEDEKWEKAPIVGTKMYQSDFITVTEVEDNGNKQYRVYLDCPIQGEKGDKVRYALKKQVKDFEGKFAGNFNLHQIYWAFPNKSKANAYIKARKDADKAYQASKQA